MELAAFFFIPLVLPLIVITVLIIGAQKMFGDYVLQEVLIFISPLPVLCSNIQFSIKMDMSQTEMDMSPFAIYPVLGVSVVCPRLQIGNIHKRGHIQIRLPAR